MNTAQITNSTNQPIHVGILGFGGLGQAATRVLAPKQEMLWVAAADQKGYAYNRQGLVRLVG
jgi:homoserine dehydrogenase